MSMLIKPHKQKSQFWHFTWKPAKIAQIMRTTRSRYHYAIRYVKKNEIIMRKEAMAQYNSKNKSRDLWKEVHKVRDKSKVYSLCLDDVTRSENIAEVFANEYKVLYNLYVQIMINSRIVNC